jgi:DNA-directed RNA polymerase subunit beta'
MMNNRNNNNKEKTCKRFNKISIGLASPESILKESRGFKTRNNKLPYAQNRRDGLFCEKNIWTCKDFECACGKYKRIRYKGIICDRCGVEVTEKST